MSTKFAIGCLVQWYEAEIIGEYISSISQAIRNYDGEVTVDVTISMNLDLEKTSLTSAEFYAVKFAMVEEFKRTFPVLNLTVTEDLVTIADYRREFNSRYCNEVDVLVWGESDMIAPKELFTSLDLLHNSQSKQTPKYLATFGTCKMWDDSWKPLEHIQFTDKPFIENDYDNWWSLKYTMSEEEMNNINNEITDLDVTVIPGHKFNGCGLVISSEVIKAGVNIPQSVFFVHEDTAFMLMVQKVLGNIPQYHFRNILLVHNRNHPKKRMYVQGESGGTLNQQRRSNEWYVKANKYSEENCYNLFNPNYKAKTWNDINKFN